MRKLAIAAAAAGATLFAGAALEARARMTPEQELNKLLEGRQAGAPVSCITQFQAREMRVIDKTALVFGWGNVIYVNVPNNAEHLDSDDVIVTHTSGGQFCDLDIVTTLDRTSQMFNGSISLGKFVPYRRVPAPK